ncbi:MAG: FG-GAP-like repeat-containing protein [Bacteroidota bacterium]
MKQQLSFQSIRYLLSLFIGLSSFMSLQAQESYDYSFNQQPEISVSGNAYDLVVDDFDDSGTPDVIATHLQNYSNLTPSSSNIITYASLNSTTQTWETNIIENTGGYASQAITAGDYNGDGHLDFAFTGNCNCFEHYLYLGDGSGSFSLETTFSGNRSTQNLKSADLNQNGQLDLFGSGNAVLRRWLNTSTVNNINLTSQSFSYSSIQSNNPNAAGVVANGDINGNGWDDIVVGNTGDGNVTVFYNNGSGSFSFDNRDQYVIGGGQNPYGLRGIEVGDFNGDGNLDIVAISRELEVVGILINDGNGSFEDVVHISGINSPEWVEVADMNSDGNLDIIVQRDNGFSILTGNGDGTFSDPYNSPSISNSRKLKITDMNNDGLKDIVLLTSSSIRIFEQEGKLKDFSYTASTYEAEATGVTYTFNYKVQTANPHYVLYALQNSSCQTWDISNVQTENIKVYVDGIPANVQFIDKSLNSGISIKLSDTSLVQSNSQIQIVIDNVNHTNQTTTCNWGWIRTTNSGGNAIDQIDDPEPMNLANIGDFAQHKALQFNGVNERASINSTSGINIGSSFTIETWLKFPENIIYNSERLLVEYGDWGAGNIQLTSFENGGVKINFHGRDGDLPVVIDGLDDGNWHHIAGTFNASNGQVHYYIDGVLISSPGTLGNTPANTSGLSLTLGARRQSNGDFIYHSNVSMDEVRIWNTARTESEIYANYNKELEGNEDQLIAYFPMNEIINGYILDATANNNDLLLFNMDETNLISGASLVNYMRNTWLGTESADTNDWNNWSSEMIPLTTESFYVRNISDFVIVPTIPGAFSTTYNEPNVLSGNTLEARKLFVENNRLLEVEGVLKVDDVFDNNGSVKFSSSENGTGYFDEFNGTISGTGSVTTEKYFPARRAFNMVSSTVNTTTSIYENWQNNGDDSAGIGTHITGGDASVGFDQTETNNPSMFVFNNGWQAISNTNNTSLETGTPYRLMVRGDRTIDLNSNESENATTLSATGNLAVGNLNFTPPTGGNSTFYSFIANPYQSRVDISEFLSSNASADNIKFWVWDPMINSRGGFVVIDELNGNGTTTPTSSMNKFIEAGQAFFIEVTNSNPTINFSETMKNVDDVSGRPVVMNDDNKQLSLILKDEENQLIDALRLRFSAGGNNDIDNYDASKMGNLDENLASINQNQLFAVQQRAFPEEDETIVLYTNNWRNTTYKFELNLENFDETPVYLIDNYLNTETLISEEIYYEFSVDPSIEASVNTMRFELKFGETTFNNEAFENNNSFAIYPNPADDVVQIKANTNSTSELSIKVFNTLGQEVISQKSKQSGVHQLDVTMLTSGVYIIKLQDEKGNVQTSQIIKK